MFARRQATVLAKCIRGGEGLGRKSYHSFPDPTEVAQSSSFKSDYKKTVDKTNGKVFSVDSKFRLDIPFPGVPIGSSLQSQSHPTTLSTKLSNGVTVASQDTLGLMTSFAFLAQTGSAFEIQDGSDFQNNTGATQMLELCAFRSTKNRSHQEMMTEIEQLGGMVQCVSSREGLLYCVDVLRENVDAAMDILADTVLNPVFPQDEIDECKEIIKLQQNEFPAEMFSRDAVQMAAYKGFPLGNSHFCPENKIESINANLINDFRSKNFVGDNCFVSGAGIEHEAFVELVEKKFKNISKGSKPILKGSTFVGGMISNERQLKEPFIKIAIGFEIGGWNDPMLVPACVLQALLGGGSSFSAGGPGKGMYTRLYREILNQHHWVESAEAFVNIHESAGLMGIDGACPPEYASNLVRVIIDQLTKLSVTQVSDEELNRAKKMLKSMMMMQLESRLVLCEDIARQYATYGFRESPASVCQKIDAVTGEDLINVAKMMMRTPPAVGCVGHDLSKVPSYEDIQTFTEKYRFSLMNKENSIH